MTSLFSPSQDYAVIDDLETVTLGSRTSGDDFSSYTVANVLRGAASVRQFSGEIVAPNSTVTFLLWQANLTAAGAPAPQQGDTITDGNGLVYSIIEVAIELVQNAFTCTCQQQV
jgi:hypothetical protein